ncbi:MAG: hypothetical protein RIS29_263 [Bacteroidota bacterium]|jgi:hypothetical protein
MKTRNHFSFSSTITTCDNFDMRNVVLHETDQPKTGDNGSNPNPPVTQPPKV